MKRAILAALLCAAPVFAGQKVMSDASGNSIRLFDKPCANEAVLQQIRPEYRDQFQLAEVTTKAEGTIPACWIEDPDGDFYVMLVDGRNGFFQGSAFKPDGV